MQKFLENKTLTVFSEFTVKGLAQGHIMATCYCEISNPLSPSLAILVQPKKTGNCHDMTEKLLTGTYSNKTNHLSCYFTSYKTMPGHVEQSVMCLTTNECLTADPGVPRLMLARSHTFMVTDHEIISMVILIHSADSRRVVVSCKRKYVHKMLVNGLVKLAREKSVVR